MEKLLSIIIAVNNAQESDLSIPLSSINNQIGVDLNQVEVIVVDNGSYKLQQPDTLKIFSKLDLQYINLQRLLQWEDAFQAGVEAAKGKYVMFMGVDSQLNQSGILQTFFYHATQHPEADVLSGLVMVERINADLHQDYQVGRDQLTVRARWLRREFLRSYDIKFSAQFRPYAEEYVCRLIKQLANLDVQIEEVSTAKFSARNLDPTVLGKPAAGVTPQWLTMMSSYFQRLQVLHQQTYVTEFARFVVRFYTQLKRTAVADRETLLPLMKTIVSKNSLAWPATMQYVAQLTSTDHNPEAPWNSERHAFDQYLNQFVDHLNTFGLRLQRL